MSTATQTRTTPSTSVGQLLVAGAVAGPLFVAVTLVQAYTRDGFDPARHPLSALALDGHGWLQIANFVLCGALAVAGAVGLRRALPTGRASTWGPRLLGIGGAALILAGIFPADPMNGYPSGAADTVTWHGIVHSMGPAVAGIAGLAAYVVFGRRFLADREHGWLAWTVAVPVAALVCDVVAFSAADFRWSLAAQLIGAVWTTSLYGKLLARRTVD